MIRRYGARSSRSQLRRCPPNIDRCAQIQGEAKDTLQAPSMVPMLHLRPEIVTDTISAREQTPFMNSARKDGLVLRHWKREGDAAPNVAGLPVTPADSNAASEMDTDDRPAANVEDSRAAKWNVKIDRPRCSAEEYDTHLKNGDWSKEETDYLVDLAIEFDLRWVVIIDRYDFRPEPKSSEPSEDAMAIDALTPQPKPRTMEDLKSRYYAVAAKCMALRTPLSSMNPTEFEEHEKMTKFDPKKEAVRKQYVEKLFLRTPEEAHEEELLLKELSRIVLNQEKLYEDRRALYDRLEAPRAINPAAAHASTTVYQSSQGLQQLMQTMMQSQRLRDAEKREKRRSALGVDTETANSHSSAADLRTGGGGGGGRSSIGSASAGGGHEKRQPHPTPQHRHFSQAERVRFGISYPQERLTSGVQFRHERVVKASQAKSAVQTTRINDALAELGIPSRLLMPTNRVVTEYERLVEGVKQLVEIRKMREKVDGEIKIWEAQRRLANGDGADEVDDQTAGENAVTNAQSEQSKDEGASKEAELKEGEHGEDASKVESKEDDDEEEAHEAARTKAEEKIEDEDETEHLENSRVEVEEDVKDEDEDEDGEGSNASQAVEEEEEDEEEDDDEEEEDEGEGEGEGEDEGDEEEQSDDDDDDEGENEDQRVDVGKDGNAVNSSENQVDDSNEDGENEDPETGANEANEPDDGSSTRARSMRKRSASVISAVSNKSTKRQKK